MSEAAHSIPSGWYPDPAGGGALRWWDGMAWTDHLHATPAAEEPQAVRTAAAQTKHQIRPRKREELFPDGSHFIVATSSSSDVLGSFTRSTWIATAVAALLGVGLVVIGWNNLFSDLGENARVAMALIIVGFLVPFAPYAVVAVRLHETMLATWASNRGFTPLSLRARDLEHVAPFFRLGTSRSVRHVLRGEAGGHPVTVAAYAVAYDKDDVPFHRLPNKAEQFRGFWTIALIQLPPAVAERYAGVSVMARRRSWPVEEGGEEVVLESVAFHEQLTVRAAPGQDPVALRELFGPQFVAALTRKPITWEQRGSTLVLIGEDVSDSTLPLDQACTDAIFVLEHYLSESR